MAKQTLFISYCWKDGNIYADELETQLRDEFEVKRDKSQLIANDDIYDFMTEIANCDNVILVLTSEYVKSLNCMLEMSYLVSQTDWAMKAMVLVIDDSLYSVERKIEIINYWMLRQKKNFNDLNSVDIGKTILEEEKELLEIAKVVGQDVLSDNKKLILEISKAIRVGFLQQSAFNKVDTSVPLIKQFKMMETALILYDTANRLIKESIPISRIKQAGFFEEYVKIKFDIGNEESEMEKFKALNKRIKSEFRKIEEEYEMHI